MTLRFTRRFVFISPDKIACAVPSVRLQTVNKKYLEFDYNLLGFIVAVIYSFIFFSALSTQKQKSIKPEFDLDIYFSTVLLQ